MAVRRTRELVSERASWRCAGGRQMGRKADGRRTDECRLNGQDKIDKDIYDKRIKLNFFKIFSLHGPDYELG